MFTATRHQTSPVGLQAKPSGLQASPAGPPVADLALAIRAIETSTFQPAQTAISTGCPAIDAELPGGGLHGGTIVEWVSDWAGDGATTLALLAVRSAMGEHRHAVLVDPQNEFYPPAAAALGIDLSRLIILRPTNNADALWCLDQSLRCPAIAAVVAWQNRIDEINARRLQLAAEQGGTLGLLLRNAKKMQGPTTWAEMTWKVRPQRTSAASAKNAADKNALDKSLEKPPNTRPYSNNYRWLHVELTRLRAGRGKSNLASHIAAGSAGFWVALEEHRGPVYARRSTVAAQPQTRQEPNHVATSAVHLAAQLAKPTTRRRAASKAG